MLSKTFLIARLRPVKLALRLVLTGGSRHRRTCNVCGYEGRFAAAGWPPRLDACCPGCNALERQRFLKFVIDRNERLVKGRKVLHFAADSYETRYIKPLAGEYVTTDLLVESRGTLRLDIEAIDQPDNSWDAVVCLHVLEHVDDRAALGELFRILRPGGVALLMVPMIHGWPATYENPAIVDPRDRALHFGQRDHVRMYGADFPDRVAAAGFRVEAFRTEEPWVTKHALARGHTLYVAHKD